MSSKIRRPQPPSAEREQIQSLQAHVVQLREQLMKVSGERAMLSPATTVAGLTIHRTVGDDMKFGRCTHALQMLPNNTVLLLVSTDGGASTFLLGEECSGFTVEKSMIETPDANPQS